MLLSWQVVRVVTRHQLGLLQEAAVEGLKADFKKVSNDGEKHLPPDNLEDVIGDAIERQISAFADAALFGPEDEIQASVRGGVGRSVGHSVGHSVIRSVMHSVGLWVFGVSQIRTYVRTCVRCMDDVCRARV